jgi:hypothetical protein
MNMAPFYRAGEIAASCPWRPTAALDGLEYLRGRLAAFYHC